jgi:hypothetical protein
MYSPAEVARALRLREQGLNISQISRATGASRSAIRAWIDGRVPQRKPAARPSLGGPAAVFPELVQFSYAYLLGMYLGDGLVSKGPRGSYRLRVFLDRAYPMIVLECQTAMKIAMPMSTPGILQHPHERMSVVNSSSKHWPFVFPQHGAGMKHTREIRLVNWQREILDRYPWRFLRGLIHSDGCRAINTIRHPKRTYAYPRYQFSNRSDDIRALFCEYCDKAGVEWRRMNRWNISIARRESVALMDRFIGPKR